MNASNGWLEEPEAIGKQGFCAIGYPHKGTPLPLCFSQGVNSKCGGRSNRLEELTVISGVNSFKDM